MCLLARSKTMVMVLLDGQVALMRQWYHVTVHPPPPRQGACMLGIGQFVKAPIGQPKALSSPNSRLVVIQYKPHWLRMLSIERQCNAYRVNTQGHFINMKKLSQGQGQWLGFFKFNKRPMLWLKWFCT